MIPIEQTRYGTILFLNCGCSGWRLLPHPSGAAVGVVVMRPCEAHADAQSMFRPSRPSGPSWACWWLLRWRLRSSQRPDVSVWVSMAPTPRGTSHMLDWLEARRYNLFQDRLNGDGRW